MTREPTQTNIQPHWGWMIIQDIHSTVIWQSDLCPDLPPGFPGSPCLLLATPQKTLIHQSRAPTHLTRARLLCRPCVWDKDNETEMFVLSPRPASCDSAARQHSCWLSVCPSATLSIVYSFTCSVSLSLSCSRSVFSVLLVVSLFWGCGFPSITYVLLLQLKHEN